MNTAKLEMLSHKGIEQWLRKGLKQVTGRPMP